MEGTYDDVASVVVSVENEDVEPVSVTTEPRVGDVVVEEAGSVAGLLNGFVGFDSTVGLGFVMAEVAKTSTDDRGAVFSVVVVACAGLDAGFEVDVGILVGFGLAIVVNGFEVVGLTVVGLTFCVGLVAAMVVNF